jgi:GNAT superfamily N-acetyltransferase
MSSSGAPPSRSSCSRLACWYRVLAHQSPGGSPGDGTIPASSTSRSTGTRSQTSGAVNPPNDWATTTSPVRSPMASTTVSAYSDSPAESSSQGRSGATTSCPRLRSSASSRCQNHPLSAAPWISTYVAMVSGPPGRGASVGQLWPGRPRHQIVGHQRGEGWAATASPAGLRHGDGVTLRELDPARDRGLLERLWEAALGPAWPVLPGGLDLVRGGLVAEGPGGGLGAVALDPAGSIPLLMVDPAHQRRGIGTRLLEAGLRRLGELGAGSVVLGSGGEDYIWPGVPEDLPAAAPFFEALGWRWDYTVIDLVADLRGYRGPALALERAAEAGVLIQVAAGRDRAEVLAFEAATFPSWLRWFDRPGGAVLVARDARGAVVGSLLFHGPPGRPSMRRCWGPRRAPSAVSGSPPELVAPGSAVPWSSGPRSCCGTRAPVPATSAGPSGSGSTPASAMCRGGATAWPAARSVGAGRSEPAVVPAPGGGRRPGGRFQVAVRLPRSQRP